jgi:glycosyltransferase involved in cell wall biosynthesis
MKVLQLAPPSRSRHAITAHTFIDEEIRALRDVGIECLTVSDAIGEPHTCDGVHVVPIPSPASLPDVVRTMALAGRYAAWLPPPGTGSARELFHALRIEQVAASLARTHGVDVIHSHFGWPGGLGGAIAAAHARVPLVASLRGMDLLIRRDLQYGLRQDALFDRAIRRLLKRADRTVYATEFMRNTGIREGAPPERTAVVRKGVDLDRFRPTANRSDAQRALGLEPPVILAIGTLRPLKGHAILFRALALLLDRSWTLVICGEGPHRPSLEREVSDLGLQNRVVFAGTVPRDRVPAYFSAADIFAHPSFIEAAGNVILEALASGCAIVASDSGGPGEQIVHGETGIIVPPGDVTALSEGLCRLLADAPLRSRLGLAARQDVERRYEYKRMIQELIAVYEVACGCSRTDEPGFSRTSSTVRLPDRQV